MDERYRAPAAELSDAREAALEPVRWIPLRVLVLLNGGIWILAGVLNAVSGTTDALTVGAVMFAIGPCLLLSCLNGPRWLVGVGAAPLFVLAAIFTAATVDPEGTDIREGPWVLAFMIGSFWSGVAVALRSQLTHMARAIARSRNPR